MFLNRVSLGGVIAVLGLAVAPCMRAEERAARFADACEQRNQEVIEQLLRNSPATLDAPQADGTRAVHWAVFHQDHRLLQRLLKSGASSSKPNGFGVTPLLLACELGDPKCIETLIAAGCDANETLPSGESALMLASRNGRTSAVGHLLAAGADPNVALKGQTALMWAASAGHAAVVDRLLAAKADPKLALGSGFDAITFAVREGHQEVVERLLEANLDVNAPMRPTRRNAKSVRNGTSLLMLALENGHFDLAIFLLQRGADPNDQRSGFTPLHAMTWVRKPNRGDGADGQAPPEVTGRTGSLAFVRELVRRGADVNARLKKGESGRGRLAHKGATAFLMASKTADIELLKLLHELGADPRLANAEGATPLMAAAGLGTKAPFEEAGTEDEAVEVATWLIELGADVNRSDRNGETAMHGAAYKNLPKMVALLARRGAKIEVWNRKNRYGWTPLLIAEGHRPGNFKPSFETIAEIHRLMRAEGLTPPPPTPRKKRIGY